MPYLRLNIQFLSSYATLSSVRRFALLPVVCFLAISLLLFPRELQKPVELTFHDDAGAYHRIASSLTTEGIYADHGVLTSEREPGYPFFLSLVYRMFGIGNRMAIFAMQILLCAVALFFFLREWKEHSSESIVLMTGLFMALMPALYAITFAVYRESVALSLALFVVMSLLRVQRTRAWRDVLLASLTIGALILTYFPFILLPLFLLPALFFFRIPSKYIAAFLLCAYVLPVGWTIRNVAHGDAVECAVPGCVRSSYAWVFRARQIRDLGMWDPAECLYIKYVTLTFDTMKPACMLGFVAREQWAIGVSNNEVRRDGREAMHVVMRHPFKHLWVSVFTFMEYHIPYLNGWGKMYNLLEASMTALLYLGIGLFIIRRRAWQRVHILLLLCMLSSALPFSLLDVVPRYRTPLLFCYAALSAAGYASLRRSHPFP